jgi:hypothetical protein
MGNMSNYRAILSEEKFDSRFEKEMGSALCPRCSAKFLVLHFQAFVDAGLVADQIAEIEKILVSDHDSIPVTEHLPSYELD